jgi:CheY-like chemotaxis protein
MSDIKVNALEAWYVLIVEDAPDNAELVARTLRHFGAQLTTVSNGAKALAELNKGDFTLIVCDLSMPELDGWELIRQMRQLERTKHTPVIALTAHAMDEDRIRVMQAGFDGYYAKPIEDVLHLVTYLMQVVASDQKVSST